MIYLVRMRPKFRAAAVALVLVGALSASGCASEAPAADPTPTPSATPLFASDEEALAAAEEAYAAYQQVSDSILIDGGAEPERLLKVATEAQYEYEKAGFDEAKANGLRSTGGSTFDTVTLRDWKDEAGDGRLVVSVLLCDDVAAVDIIDRQGQSVVDSSKPARFPRVAYFDLAASDREQLLVSTIEEWDGENFCVAD